MFGFLFTALARVLEYCYQVLPSYGGAIVLLTLVVMLALYPLTAKGTRSMMAMQRIQPEIKKLQDLHKSDRNKLNEEMMALYKKHGVNPLSGCLPLLLQFPVFIILFRVIAGLTHCVIAGALVTGGTSKAIPNLHVTHVTGKATPSAHIKAARGVREPISHASVKGTVTSNGKVVGTLSGAHATNGILVGASADKPAKVMKNGKLVGTIQGAHISGILYAQPKYIRKESKLSLDLQKTPGQMKSFGMDLAEKVTDHHSGSLGAFPYWAMLILMGVSQYIQQWQLSRRQNTANNPQAKQMQMLTKFLPIVFVFISLRFPAGVIIYWTVSNVFRIGQQSLIGTGPSFDEEVEEMREEVDAQIAVDKKSGAKPSAAGSKKKKKGR